MSFAAADPIPSGQQHPVMLVARRPPAELTDFVGQGVVLTLARAGVEHVVTGNGSHNGDGVRFHEKDASSGKDVRVWHIAGVDGGGFTAASV
jgi:hypothetical protein